MFQESIAKEFLDRIVKWIKNIKISDPLEEGCRLGPVVSEGQVYFLFLISKWKFIDKYNIIHHELRSSCMYPGVIHYVGPVKRHKTHIYEEGTFYRSLRSSHI